MLIIQKILKNKGITQLELADKLGISNTALRKQINGNPTIETLQKFSKALNVEVRDLFDYDKSKKPIHLIINDELKTFDNFNELKSFVDSYSD